jgi:CDP-diacylglycerol--glycerol-3-phosphate 3-phosphatidyltransferase
VIALIAADPSPLWVDVLVYVAVAMTVISGLDYFFGLRRRFEEERDRRTGAKTKPGSPGVS